MYKLEIFIASSNALRAERNAIRDVINSENNKLDKYDVHIKPIMWELESSMFREPRKQDEYNRALISSNIAIFLIGTRVGYFTDEEFKKACVSWKESGKPQILVYFEEDLHMTSSAGTIQLQAQANGLHGIAELQKKITGLQQVWDSFKSIEDLSLKVYKELYRQILPAVSAKDTPELDDHINELIEAYLHVGSPFQERTKNEIVAEAISDLRQLFRFGKPYSEREFLEMCYAQCGQVKKGEYIRAISTLLPNEWSSSLEEKKFWQANVEAINRGVFLERIFIVKKSESHRLGHIAQIAEHANLNRQNFSSFVIEREELEHEEATLFASAGEGFLLFESCALLDISPENKIRGYLEDRNEELSKLHRTFESLKTYAVPLQQYLQEIQLSHIKKEMLSVFLTTKCNLNCDYCFTNKNEGTHHDQTISFDFVKNGITEYFATEYIRHIRFFGAGEPTVEFPLMKEIFRFSKDQGGDSVSFEIQTNGAFSETIAHWLGKNIDIIWISCDGTPDIQNSHRPMLSSRTKSSDLIERNIGIIQRAQKSSNRVIGIRATITEENVDKQISMIDYFRGLGIYEIWVDPLFLSVGEAPANSEQPLLDTMHFAEQFAAACTYAAELGVFYGSILTCNFADEVTQHCRACLPLPHLTTDGYVSACDMALFGNDNNHMQAFIYGKWNEEFKAIVYDNKKIEALRTRTTEEMEHCLGCPSQLHCGGYCLGEVLNETGSLIGQKKGVCEAIRYLDSRIDYGLRVYHHCHP